MRKPRRRALWADAACKSCGAPVIFAEERVTGGRARPALLDKSPASWGILALGKDGYIIRDPDREALGARYLWHHCPVRNAPLREREKGEKKSA